MKFIEKFLAQKPSYRQIAISSIVIFSLLALASSIFRSFNHDEFEAVHVGWKIISGEKIYIDFLQHHHFLFYYVISWFLVLFGSSTKTIIILRVFSFIVAVVIAWLVYKMAEMKYGKNVALLSVFFLSTTVIFLQKVLEIRPDVPYLLSGLISVFFLLKYFESKRIINLVLSSIALFASFLFLQKAVFLIFLVGVLFLYKIFKKELVWKEFFLYWGILLILLLFFLWYVSATFSFSEYFFLNWILNTKLLNTFPLCKYLLISFGQNPLFWSLFVASIVIAVRKRTFDIFFYFAIGLLGFIFLTKSPFPQYYLTSVPFISIVAGKLFKDTYDSKPKLMTAILFVSVLWAAFFLYDASDSNHDQLEKINYVLAVTNENDRVYDGEIFFNVFRKDIDYFWFSVKPKTGVMESYKLMRNYNYDPYALIEEFKPKVISKSFLKVKNEAISANYVQSEKYKDLYIRK